MGAWNGAGIPSKIVQYPDGSVDVNGDGKSNGVFMGSQDISLYDISTERKRKAINASFQADFGHGFTMTSDYFYTHQDQFDRNVGIQFNSTNWQGATYVPVNPRNTGSTTIGQYNTPDDPNAGTWAGSHIYTTRCTKSGLGTLNRSRRSPVGTSTAQNINLQLDFDNGGPFKASIAASAKPPPAYIETDINISDSDGCLWADPNTSLPCGTFVYPGGTGRQSRIQCQRNSPEHRSHTANFSGRNLAVSMPPSLSSAFANPNGWTMKTLESD